MSNRTNFRLVFFIIISLSSLNIILTTNILFFSVLNMQGIRKYPMNFL